MFQSSQPLVAWSSTIAENPDENPHAAKKYLSAAIPVTVSYKPEFPFLFSLSGHPHRAPLNVAEKTVDGALSDFMAGANFQ